MRLQFLTIFVTILAFFQSAQAGVDCSDPKNTYVQKCLLAVSCQNVKGLEFGGDSYSNFETFSCSRLITMYKASEKEGNFSRRIEEFIKKNGIKTRFISDCPKGRSEERKNCVLGVYKLIDKIEADRNAFIDVLRFKTQVYDSLFQLNGKKDLVGENCDLPPSAKSPREYRYNKSDYSSDCELVHLNLPSCQLKLGVAPNYSAANKGYLDDRKVCQDFIDANTKVDKEPFSTGLKKDSYAEQAPTTREKKPDCSKFDPNNLKAFQANPANLDSTLYCLDPPAGGSNGSSSSTNGVRTKN